jgi:hypothetical protein
MKGRVSPSQLVFDRPIAVIDTDEGASRRPPTVIEVLIFGAPASTSMRGQVATGPQPWPKMRWPPTSTARKGCRLVLAFSRLGPQLGR